MESDNLHKLMIFCAEFGWGAKLNFRIPKTRLWVDVSLQEDTEMTDDRIRALRYAEHFCSCNYYAEIETTLEGLMKVKEICNVLSYWTCPQNFTYNMEPVFSWKYEKLIRKQKEAETIQLLRNLINDPTRYLALAEELSSLGYLFWEDVVKFLEYTSMTLNTRGVNVYRKIITMPEKRYERLKQEIYDTTQRLVRLTRSGRKSYLLHRLLKGKEPIGEVDERILEAYSEVLELNLQIKKAIK